MKRTAWITCAAVALFFSMRGAGVAQDSGPTMQATVGFDGYCRRGDWCPVYVELSNEGADVEAELRILVGTGSGTGDDAYATEVILPAGSRKAYTLYIPPSGFSVRSHFVVRLVAGDDVLALEEIVVARLEEGDRLYGVASGGLSELNFLADVAPPGGRARVAHLNLETLPPDPLGWEGLDVLILDDVDTTALSTERRQALETWVIHGGHLIVCGGAGGARTVAGVADLLPVAVGDTRAVADLRALGAQTGASVSTGPYAVNEATLRDGDVLIEQDGLILIARRAYGGGKVDFLAFAPDLNPFTHWDDNVRLWEKTISSGDTGAQALTVRNGYNAREAVSTIPGLELPSTLQILVFLLAYTLLIGPVNYIVLRKLNKREWAWLTIPLLILGFTVYAYVTGFQVRGGKTIVHRLAAVYVPEGASVGRVSQAVGIFSPRRTKYDVWVTGAEVSQIPNDFYDGPPQQSLDIHRKAGGLIITDLRVDVGGIQPFVAEGYMGVPGVGSDLRLAADETGELWLRGTVRNGDMPLEDAVLIAGNGEQRLGDLEPGEEIDISFSLHVGSVITSTMAPQYYGESGVAERILGPGDYWSDVTLHRRYQFLQAISNLSDPFGPGWVSDVGHAALGAGAHLIGWTEGEHVLSVDVDVDAKSVSPAETALYVYSLPAASLDAGATASVPPSLIARELVETSGYVDVQGGRLHLETESQVVFRFTVWPAAMVRRVDGLVLDVWWSGSGYAEGSPTVFLWNHENDEWDRLDVGWGRHSIPDAGAYVSQSGSVLLRLKASEFYPAEVENVTITIEGQL